MTAHYGIVSQHTAIIEMAACAGLPLVEGHQDPEKTTTFGVGQLMLDAVKRGCRKIIVGLGEMCRRDRDDLALEGIAPLAQRKIVLVYVPVDHGAGEIIEIIQPHAVAAHM